MTITLPSPAVTYLRRYRLTDAALKAENDDPPAWYRNSVMLRKLLEGAWGDVSKDWARQVKDAFESGDKRALTELTQQTEKLGKEMGNALGNKPEAILLNCQQKANAFWRLHGKEIGFDKVPDYRDAHQIALRKLHANQVRLSAEQMPTRILHPELIRQIDYMAMPGGRAVEMSRVQERLERLTSQKHHWEHLSDLQVARLWHHDGVLMAEEAGVKTGYVTGPLDKKTCPVCRHMLGAEINIPAYAKKIRQSFDLADRDEYAAAWPFPRIGDVDNMSRAELNSKMIRMPPFHGRCRHSVAWRTGTIARPVAQPQPSQAPPISDEAKAIFVKEEHQRLYDKYMKEFEGKTSDELRDIARRDENLFRYAEASWGEWQANCKRAGALLLKYQTRRLEGCRGGVRFYHAWEGSKTEKGVIKALNETAPDSLAVFTDDNYIKLRAINQASLKAKGVDEITLYRGIDGKKTGPEMARNLQESLDSGVDNIRVTINTDAMESYSPDVMVGRQFGTGLKTVPPRGPGITIRRRVKRLDIVIENDFFPKDLAEAEYVVRNKARKYVAEGHDIEIRPRDEEANKRRLESNDIVPMIEAPVKKKRSR